MCEGESWLVTAASVQLGVKWSPSFQLIFLPVLSIFGTCMLMMQWLKYVARCVWQVSL